MTKPIEHKIVFGLGDTAAGKLIMLGVPQGAWEYMSDGKTHTFDLNRAGIPVQIIMFGGATHDECMSVLQAAFAGADCTYADMRREDFSIHPPEAPAAEPQAEADDGVVPWKNGRELLIAADTREIPGKVKILTVEFHTHFVQTSRFERMRFKLLDKRHPHARPLRVALTGRDEG